MKPSKVSLLSNSHLDTIAPIYLSQAFEPPYVRERINTPDHDFIDLDWIHKDLTSVPTVVLFHGTEGNSKSHYAKRLMYHLEQIGWRGVVPHFRSCSEELNRKPRFYHAGDTEDMRWILTNIRAMTPAPLFAVGVSLGGNALLKYLGEYQTNILDAAFAMSVPFDLLACIDALDSTLFNKHIYVKHFLSSLLPKMKEYAKQFDNFNYVDRKIDTLDEFNNTYICQFFDFKDAYDYYQKASCISYLKYINVPTMILQAQNDPMIPVSSWPDRNDLPKSVRFIATQTGGHAGFMPISTNYKESLFKLPKFMIEYFKQFTSPQTANAMSDEEIIDFLEI